MTDPDVKLVKVDNWGIYFLQRLKHFFNRTDYCDLTLQFQDNAQLKVHRLVLSACTEYFELLERTCEMYEDCLVMPDDLQADVVVPIVNFMYTGQLEFRMDLLERLYLTSQVMDMPVLTKLLEAHRSQAVITPLKFSNAKRSYTKAKDQPSSAKSMSTTSSVKRSYSTALSTGKKSVLNRSDKPDGMPFNNEVRPLSDSLIYKPTAPKKPKLFEPRPTRYELPEELDTDNIFDNSFTNISYTSKPLMVHPSAATKQYQPKKNNLLSEGSGSHKFSSTMEIVECKKVSNPDIFEDDPLRTVDDDMFPPVQSKAQKPLSQNLFDQVIESPNDGPKVTIETKDAKQANNIDHAKIISEVLKKYPHLVKSNKNIKLKILNSPTTPAVNKNKPKRQATSATPIATAYEPSIIKKEASDYTYESDVLDSKEAAKLIAMGADNINGPWICLICGTPGRALHFTSYYNFRRHLVEVHKEKPISTMCEYCGLKSVKRNYFYHHLYTVHGVEPPPNFKYPKCNLCNYIALSEVMLQKHKSGHSHKHFRCVICNVYFNTSRQLMEHIRKSGHKYGSDNKKDYVQCIYCTKEFAQEHNLINHIKASHKKAAKRDGILEDSGDEQESNKPLVKYEPAVEYEEEYETQYQIRPDGNLEIVPKKPGVTRSPPKQKILNTGLNPSQFKMLKKPQNNFDNSPDASNEEIVVIDNNEYVMRENQLILKQKSHEYSVPMMSSQINQESSPSTSLQYANIQTPIQQVRTPQRMIVNKTQAINQPIQIVVSNEEEYNSLMNSNHSIIFDDTEPNKTLTVLTTPHGPTLSTDNIDLDNTQTGDMMILPDSFPMNETLPTDNSNIVVVYGTSDTQQNQYQIITSQDIGSQFVQSSSVITQSFGSITTSTPVVGAHVIDAQVEESWQSDIQNQPNTTEIQEIQQIIPSEEITHIDTDVTDMATELPEVTLTSSSEIATCETDLQENTTEINDNAELSAQEEDDIQNNPLAPMEVNDPVELDLNKDQTIINATEQDAAIVEDNIEGDESAECATPIETVTQMVVNTESTDKPSSVENDEGKYVETHPGHEEIIESAPEQETVITTSENTTVSNSENDHLTQNGKNDVSANTIESDHQAISQEANIQNLASEWSEDEYDALDQEKVNESKENQQGANEVEEEAKEATAELVEDEESIENIQQEIEKQTQISSQVVTNEDVNNSNNKTKNVSDLAATESTKQIPQEKITSLLSDWDENDSQENDSQENESFKETEAKNPNVEENTTATPENIVQQQNTTDNSVNLQLKPDKIQSLVSDWDDDEEDGKTA